jgi:hypothetical protein
MVAMRRHSLAALVVVGLLAAAGCTAPPKEAYVAGTQSGRGEGGLALGKNSTGEDCIQQPLGEGADVYCGTWLQPSARVRQPARSRTLSGGRSSTIVQTRFSGSTSSRSAGRSPDGEASPATDVTTSTPRVR